MTARTLIILATTGLLATVSVAAPADRSAAEEAVAVQIGDAQVTFWPNVGGDAISARLSCADGSFAEMKSETVAPVSLPFAAVNGRCKYQVHIHPPVDREALRRAEEADDDATMERISRLEQEQTVVVHGSFTMVDGTAVVPARPQTDN